MINYILAIIFLVIISLIDIKTFNLKDGRIPAALTTTFLILSIIYNKNILAAVIALTIGLLLVDLDLFKGMADLKVFIAAGALMPGWFWVLGFALGTSLLGFVYVLIMKKYTKLKEIPFIPAITMSYIISIGVILWVI